MSGTVSHEAMLQAGVASKNITPDGPVEMSGYGAREGLSSGVHDSLSASAVVFDDGAVTVGLLSVDVLNVSRELTHQVRQSLADDGIVLDGLFIAATHTHAGPYLPARALDVSPPLQAETDVSDTVASIERGLVAALTAAYERREAATVRIGHDSETTVPENRRKTGGVSGNVRVPWGTVDPEVTALLIETASGERAVVYNFACHPVCTTAGETELSADWPGYARRRIRAQYGDVPVLFLNGAAGDINPSGMDSDRTGDAVYEYMAEIGTSVGDAVCRALEAATNSTAVTMRRPPIQIDQADVSLPVKETPPESVIRDRIADLESQLERLEANGDQVGHTKLAHNHQYAEELLAIARWDVTHLPTHIPYIELGEVGLLGMPGEVFVRHGLELKARTRVSTLVPAGYVNGYIGYVPPLSALEQIGYEVRTAKIAPEAVVRFREATLDLIT
ncbi:hypothetical protein G6M89_16615 [Natronolimnobius sp. AArcel1]|uniref:neutral/alkaline non-lysosomal ceramidase N-terminal domain-containing protein n=1 Tax=Natronolimnobius sp. AArcel1 TaxID=1679093 RepID=UPI0013EB7078|nr:neutral/alkaline non-lysosomal ceramidase N-terminal domain-containing protein [Natronolimnobius sp. AArcel1]NGM70606.1 hypothetical protein [Natronolimnobius sp. AArcel1]